MKVYHHGSREDWDKPRDGNKSWREYWEDHSGETFDGRCRDCGEHSSDIVGAHVGKCDSDDKSVYIIPTCRGCNSSAGNSKEKRVFEVKANELVPANVDKINEDDTVDEALLKLAHLDK